MTTSSPDQSSVLGQSNKRPDTTEAMLRIYTEPTVHNLAQCLREMLDCYWGAGDGEPEPFFIWRVKDTLANYEKQHAEWLRRELDRLSQERAKATGAA